MQSHCRLQRNWPCLLGGLGALLWVACAQAQQPAVVLPPDPSPIQSTFVNDPNLGKDPFFPKSKRRIPQTPVVEVKPVELAVEGLELKGLSGSAQGRLAIINNRTFAVGEEHTVKVNQHRIPVKLLEIRDDHVVIGVEGTTRELHFKKKL